MFNVALTDDQVLTIAEALGMDVDPNVMEDFEVGELLDQFIDENA